MPYRLNRPPLAWYLLGGDQCDTAVSLVGLSLHDEAVMIHLRRISSAATDYVEVATGPAVWNGFYWSDGTKFPLFRSLDSMVRHGCF